MDDPAILEAAKLAVAIYASEHPVPSHVSVQQAAEMLKVSTRTVTRRKPPLNKFGKIPYRWVLEAIAESK